MRTLTLLIALLLAFPALALEPGIYRASITLELVKNLDMVRIKCEIMGGDPLLVHGWVGCSKRYRGFCHVVVVPPLSWADGHRIMILGHELLHCVGEAKHS